MADTDKPAAGFWAISTLKQNVIANLLGRGWSALMALAFVPFYLRYIGVEGYALVDAYAGYRTRFGDLTFAVHNLLDKQYITYNSDTTRPTDNNLYFAGRGRTLTLGISKEF